MRFYLLFSLLCFASSSFASTTPIYRWVTKDGQVVFSDQPVPGAQKLDLSAQVQNSTQLKPLTQNTVNSQASEPTPDPINLRFQNLNDQASIHNATGNLTVTASLDVPLGVTQQLRLLLDGRPYGTPQQSAQFQLTNIDRGEHKVQLQLLNSQEDVLAESPALTFYLHRPSKLNR